MSHTSNKRPHGFKLMDLPDQPSNLSGEPIPGKNNYDPTCEGATLRNSQYSLIRRSRPSENKQFAQVHGSAKQ